MSNLPSDNSGRNDPTAELTVHAPHPENRDRDNVVMDGKVLPRAEARALMGVKADIKPKKGVVRAQELQHLLQKGKISESLHAKLQADALAGGTAEYTQAEADQYRAQDQQLASERQFAQANDSIIDRAEIIQRKYDNGEPVNRESVKQMDDLFMQFLREADRIGLPADHERRTGMAEYIRQIKATIIAANNSKL